MSRIPAFLLAMLWAITVWASADAYEFPIENRWKATVIGTPSDYRAELPEKIPLN